MPLDADRRPNTTDESRLMRMMCSAGGSCSCADNNMQWRDQTCAVVELHARRTVAAMRKDPMFAPFHVREGETVIEAWKRTVKEYEAQ